MELYYPLKDPIPKPDLRLILQQAGIASTEDGLGQMHFSYTVTAQLASNYLMLYSPDVVNPQGTPSAEMEARAKKLLDEKALDLEATLAKFYSFKLLRSDKDTLISYFSKEEIAHQAHAMAEASEQSKVVLCHHPLDGKEREVIDSSKARTLGFKEMESVHKLSAGPDSDVVDRELGPVEAEEQDWNDLLDGKIHLSDGPKAMQLAIENTKSTSELIAIAESALSAVKTVAEERRRDREDIHLLAENQASHASVLIKLNSVADYLQPSMAAVMQHNAELEAKVSYLESQLRARKGWMEKLHLKR
jgi:hypothetical protein